MASGSARAGPDASIYTPGTSSPGVLSLDDSRISVILDPVINQKMRETHIAKTEYEDLLTYSTETGISFKRLLFSMAKLAPSCKFNFPRLGGNDPFTIHMVKGTKPDEDFISYDYPDKSVREDETVTPVNRTIADIAGHHQKMVASISDEIRIAKAIDISDGKISQEQVIALAETISRVSNEIWEQERNVVLRLSADKIYAWALPRSSIVYPYLNLKKAAEHIKAARLTPERLTWGYVDDKFHLPKIESVQDSNLWDMIRNTLEANYGRENVLCDRDFDSSMPELSNEEMVKKPALEAVVIRILELFKSPLTATIRGSQLDKVEIAIKNQVDFLVLNRIYQRDEDYRGLNLSGIALSQGRRVERVSKSEGKRVVFTPTLTGVKLAETLADYLTNKTTKVPEHEPFVRFIFSILDKISDDIDTSKYQIPQIFFTAPSEQLRSIVRKGPVIKTKKGERTNLYIPLSFVKASECDSMPESIKKILTDTGAGVIKHLDSINKLPVKVASLMNSAFAEYVHIAYSFSDEIRKIWRSEAKFPQNAHSFRELFCEKFIDYKEPLDDYQRKFGVYLDRMRNLKIRFSPVKDEPDEQARLSERIRLAVKEKKDSRAKAR